MIEFPKKRALRRHSTKVRKNRARRLMGRWLSHPERIADHMASCSCAACGNPRKHWGEITMSEKRADQRLRDGMLEAQELI